MLSAAGADSLRPAADSIAVAGDSLLLHDGAAAGADSLSAAVPAADGVGGVAASVSDAVTGGADTAAVASWVADTVQNLLVAVVVFLYIFCLYRYFDDVKALLGSVFRRSVAPSERQGASPAQASLARAAARQGLTGHERPEVLVCSE